jgi:hypothetical protein
MKQRTTLSIWERAIRSYLIARGLAPHPTLPSMNAVASFPAVLADQRDRDAISTVPKASADSAGPVNPAAPPRRLTRAYERDGAGPRPVQVSPSSSSRHRPVREPQ